jgi:hypothetical protein
VDYIAEIYAELSGIDAEIIEHHSALYRRFAPDSLARSIELGAGPNLYPLLLAAAASRQIDAVERSAANVAYLRRQLRDGPDDTWRPFYDLCRRHNGTLPPTMAEALSRVNIIHGDAWTIPAARDYDLASMHFVAEGATEDADEFAAFCRAFVDSVRPGGTLVAAFVAGLRRYRLRSGPVWPAYPVDIDTVGDVFGAITEELTLTHVEPDQLTLDYGATGMILLTARRPATELV